MNTKHFVSGFKAAEKNQHKGNMDATQFIEWLDQSGREEDYISGAKHWYGLWKGTPPERLA